MKYDLKTFIWSKTRKALFPIMLELLLRSWWLDGLAPCCSETLQVHGNSCCGRSHYNLDTDTSTSTQLEATVATRLPTHQNNYTRGIQHILFFRRVFDFVHYPNTVNSFFLNLKLKKSTFFEINQFINTYNLFF